MNENNNQNDQSTKEQHPSDETEPELREISEEELKQILEDHKKWVESDGKEGIKANFQNTNLEGRSGHRANFEKQNLQGVSFRNANINHGIFNKAILDSADFYRAKLKKANFRNAKLTNSKFRKADLTVADFQNAQLQKANFEKAILMNSKLDEAECQDANFRKAKLANAHFANAYMERANFQKADLSYVNDLNKAKLKYADLRGVLGLLGNEFAQANVTGTKLPDDIKDFKMLQVVEEVSKNARKIFFVMLLGCAYSILAIESTSHTNLLTNNASTPLPIIGTEISIVSFFLIAPLVLIGTYFYFHFYLFKLWESLSGLPAIFPDGKRLDERAYPWLLNGIVRRYFRLLKFSRPLMAYLQEWVTIFLAWYAVPYTIITIWVGYLPRHEWFITYVHIVLIMASFASLFAFYRWCTFTLLRKNKVTFRFLFFWKDRRFYYSVNIAVVGILFSLLSYGAINGVRPPEKWESKEINLFDIKEIVPLLFRNLNFTTYAYLRETAVSEKPENYWLIPKEERLESIIGANLKYRNLVNADMFRAFLVRADLRKANLEGANLESAIINKGNLEDAILKRARLEKANLQGANLKNANLEKSNLISANLQEAYLVGANLNGADLLGANLTKSNFERAEIKNTNLFGAVLSFAKLQNANFMNSSFYKAMLNGANFDGTNITSAIFGYSDLSDAKHLTIEQLCETKTLFGSKLDSDLMEQVRKSCPQLLEDPAEEKKQAN